MSPFLFLPVKVRREILFSSFLCHNHKHEKTKYSRNDKNNVSVWNLLHLTESIESVTFIVRLEMRVKQWANAMTSRAVSESSNFWAKSSHWYCENKNDSKSKQYVGKINSKKCKNRKTTALERSWEPFTFIYLFLWFPCGK